MTVSTTSYAAIGVGNGATTVFSFSFIADSAATMEVFYTDVNGTKTLLSPAVYTLFINAPAVGALWGVGGTVTYPLAGSPIPTGSSITIQRIVPYTQTISIANQGAFYPQAVEQGLDILGLQIQQLAGEVQRSIRAPIEDGAIDMVLPVAATRASKFLAFDTAGLPAPISLTGIPTIIAATSLEVFLSKSASLAAADAAAVILGACLVIDANATLGVNTTLASQFVRFAGGKITRGAFNLIFNGAIIAPDVALFDKAGAGTVTIGKGAANTTWFGISKDNVTDDTAALNRAFASCLSVMHTNGSSVFTGTLLIAQTGASIFGLGPSSALKTGGGVAVTTVTGSNVSIRNLTYGSITGNGLGIKIGPSGSVSNIILEDIQFTGGVGNAVWLFTCADVWVNRCYFNHISFGILQEIATVCSVIKITNCVAADMLATFAVFNGAGTIGSDIIIDNCTYLGANNWTSPQTNQNFVDLTTTNDVRITNNWVQNTAGDSVIHLEDAGSGRVLIQGNMFFDCNVSGGVDGWIGVFQTSKILTLLDNWFTKTAALATACYALTTASGSYGNPMIISRNYFIGTSGNTFGGLNLTGHSGQTVITDNFGSGLSTFADVTSSGSKQFRGNIVQSTLNGITNLGAAAGGTTIDITGNVFNCTTRGIVATATGGGTNKPTGWNILNNNITGAGGVSITDGVNCFHMGNHYPVGFAGPSRSVVNGTPTTCLDKFNFLDGTGLVNP